MAGNHNSGMRPLPTAIHLLNGRDPGRIHEPQIDPGIPPCPDWLHPEAKEEWDRVAVELLNIGVLTMVDRVALAGYCQSYARWVQSERARDQYGDTMIGAKGGIIQRPEVIISNHERTQMRQFLTEFGLTPASRAQIKVPANHNKDPFQEFINKRANPKMG